MPWKTPPPEVRRIVEQALGDGIWEELEASWRRVLAVDPSLGSLIVKDPHANWYRSPEQQAAELRQNPDAARLSQHMLGLAVDFTPPEATREAVLAEARRHFQVITYTRNRHVHLQALTRDQLARSNLAKYLSAAIGRATGE